MLSHTSHSLEETRQIAAGWLKSMAEKYGRLDEALVVGLSGHLGAGKTAFTKAIAKELLVEQTVTSPTFVIMKMYEASPRYIEARPRDSAPRIAIPWKKLIHIDAYRLEKPEEMEALGLEKLVADKGNLILIEWPENVGLKDFREGAYLKFDIRDGHYILSY